MDSQALHTYFVKLDGMLTVNGTWNGSDALSWTTMAIVMRSMERTHSVATTIFAIVRDRVAFAHQTTRKVCTVIAWNCISGGAPIKK
jgi:hypothetical protein